jgi:hypothetical protein
LLLGKAAEKTGPGHETRVCQGQAQAQTSEYISYKTAKII